jgi:hypothetical protein
MTGPRQALVKVSGGSESLPPRASRDEASVRGSTTEGEPCPRPPSTREQLGRTLPVRRHDESRVQPEAPHRLGRRVHDIVTGTARRFFTSGDDLRKLESLTFWLESVLGGESFRAIDRRKDRIARNAQRIDVSPSMRSVDRLLLRQENIWLDGESRLPAEKTKSRKQGSMSSQPPLTPPRAMSVCLFEGRPHSWISCGNLACRAY